MKLTRKQAAVLNFIVEHQRKHGYQPSYREIRDHFGFASLNSVTALENKGLLKRGKQMGRAIEITPSIFSFLGAWPEIRGTCK